MRLPTQRLPGQPGRRPPAILPFSLVMAAVSLLPVPEALRADPVRLSLMFGERIRVSERSNLSRSEDGRYVGLMNSQVTGYLTRIADTDGIGEFAGRMLVYEETLRDMSQVGRGVDDSYGASITTTPRTGFTMSQLVPRYLGIPTLPDRGLSPGDTWSAPGQMIVSLPNKAPAVTVNVEVAYRYTGASQYAGDPVHLIEAQFATRYPPPPDPEQDPADQIPHRSDVFRILGRHSLTMRLPQTGGLGPTPSSAVREPLFIRDEMEEQYELAGAPATLVRGHVLTFVSGLSAQGQADIANLLQDRFQDTPAPDLSIDQTNTGTRITVQNIRFVPDQAVILSEERGRLGRIAEVLGPLEDVRFLVVGHTADVGTVESQIELSWERARVVVAELIGLGMDAASFDLEGRGGSEPVASNETEAGRAQNRRVEIYVLEE